MKTSVVATALLLSACASGGGAEEAAPNPYPQRIQWDGRPAWSVDCAVGDEKGCYDYALAQCPGGYFKIGNPQLSKNKAGSWLNVRFGCQ